MVYIQRKDGKQLETVDQFETRKRGAGNVEGIPTKRL